MRKLVVPALPGRALVAVMGFLAMTAVRAAAEPLSLESCVRLALKNNLVVEQAEGAFRSARAGVTGARAAFMPRLSTSGRWTRTEVGRLVEQRGSLAFYDEFWSLSADASLTVFDGLGNVAAYRRAGHARESAEQSVHKAQQDVVHETERRFFEVRRQQALLEVQENAVELSGEQLKKTQAMKDLGAATQADVFKAEVDHSNNRLALLRSERDVAVAKASLLTYLGHDPREDVELSEEELGDGTEMDVDMAMERALDVNPDLQAARATVQANESGVTVAKADRYPSLSLWWNTDFFNVELSDFDDEHFEWAYGASVSFTVFDGFLTKSNIRRAQSDLVTSRRSVESAERDVLFAVRQAALDLEIARQAIPVAEEAVRSSEEDLRMAQERYKLGEGTILDVIDAQVNLTRSRSELVTATYDRRLAVSALRHAIGDMPVPAE